MKKCGNHITILVTDSKSEKYYMRHSVPILPTIAVPHNLPYRARKLHAACGAAGYGFILRLEKSASGHICEWTERTWASNMSISNFSLSWNYLSVWKISSCSAWDREWQSCTEGRYGEWRTAPRGQRRVGGDADASWGCGQSETKWTTGLLHHHHSTGAGILQPSEHHFPLIVPEMVESNFSTF